MGQGNCYILLQVLLYSPCWSALLKSTVFLVIAILFQYKIMLDDSSTGTELHLKYDSISIE